MWHLASGDLWAGAEVQIATTVCYLNRQPDVKLRAILFNEGRLAHELRQCGVRVTVIDETKRNFVDILKELHILFGNNRIDILHTHRYKENILGSVAARLRGVPHVVRTVHGLSEPLRGWARIKGCFYGKLDKLALVWLTDRIIGVSRKIVESLEELGVRRSKIRCIHNGIDVNRLIAVKDARETRNDLGIDPNTIVIGTVGRLMPVKGQEYLIRAAKIMGRDRAAKFLIVGTGPLKDDLAALARNLGIEADVLFLGQRDDIYDLINAMDIFILPSIDEGIPMVILEAMSLSKPIIATCVGGIPEIITDGVNGLLVEPKNEQRLAEACLHLIRDYGNAKQLGLRANKVAQEKFSHKRCGEMLLTLYESLAERKHISSGGRQ